MNRVFLTNVVPIKRIHALQKLRAKLFNTNFNPTGQRLGTKILRQRLRGPNLSQYYPPRFNPVTELRKAFPNAEVEDEPEEARLESVDRKKDRGKGVPKKRTKEESKQLGKRRK